jgi:hypothetical protein
VRAALRVAMNPTVGRLRDGLATRTVRTARTTLSVLSPHSSIVVCTVFPTRRVQYVETPYGIGRLILPFVPRTDGIVLVQLGWGVLHTRESGLTRRDDYRQQQRDAWKAAKAEEAAEKRNVTQGKITPTSTTPPARTALVEFPSFAPLHVPMYRRRQTLALTVSSFWALVCVALSLWCVRSSGLILALFLAYVVWMLLLQEYHKNGRGFKSERFRRLQWWCWFRDYFPISLHATTPLDPQSRYIFCYHPHGILSLGETDNERRQLRLHWCICSAAVRPSPEHDAA